MTRRTNFATRIAAVACFASTACIAVTAGGGQAVAGEGTSYPYRSAYPHAHPDRYSYVRQAPYKKFPQMTYRWDAARGTWYQTGGNWRYWNPMKTVEEPIVTAPDWPPVPSGVYVRPR